jgi:hypothetical protein
MAFGFMAVLPGAQELDRVLALAQLLDQARKRQSNAIDLGGPGFGHHRNAQWCVGGHKVFNPVVRIVLFLHAPMVNAGFNSLMTKALSLIFHTN